MPVHAQAKPQPLQISEPSDAVRELVLSPVVRQAITGTITATAIVEPNAGAIAEEMKVCSTLTFCRPPLFR